MTLGDQAAIRVGISHVEPEPRRGANPWRRGLRIAFRKPLGAFSLAIIAVMLFFAFAAPLVQRYDPKDTFNTANAGYNPNSTNFRTNERDQFLLDDNAAPTTAHWLGTDNGGRDIWSRLVWGARRSLQISVLAVLVAVSAGAFLGVISGYFGGAFDALLQRLLDALQAFPPLLLLILIATTLALTTTNLIFALGLIGVTQVSRLTRGNVLALRELPFIEAARVLGATNGRIMLRHVLPNTLPTLIVVFTVGLPVVIIAEAALSFLGLVPPSPNGSWGVTLNDGVKIISTSGWQALFAGSAITLVVLAFNLAGDALRDVLDPRLRT